MNKTSNPEYYKKWKEKKYLHLKYHQSFVYNVGGSAGLSFLAGEAKTVKLSLRKGMQFLQSGFKASVTSINARRLSQDISFIEKNIGGFEILSNVSLLDVVGTLGNLGDSYLETTWQWVEGEQITFELKNNGLQTGLVKLSMFGTNIYV